MAAMSTNTLSFSSPRLALSQGFQFAERKFFQGKLYASVSILLTVMLLRVFAEHSKIDHFYQILSAEILVGKEAAHRTNIH